MNNGNKGPVGYHIWKRIGDKSGVENKKSGSRHISINGRYALTKDIKLVALESGNSPASIRKYYSPPTSIENAKYWFSL